MEDLVIREENSEMVDDVVRPQKVLHDCPKCSRSFANIGHMKCHFYRVHPEFKLTEFVECEPPDTTKVCRLCGAGFETRRELNKHDCPGWEDGSRTQTYLCAHCDRRFNNKTSLQLHCMRQHRKGAKHTCALCQKGFASAPNLAAHMRIHAMRGEDKPEEVFAASEENNGEVPDVKEEVLAPPPSAFQCNVCDEGFKTARSLKSHMSAHHEEAPLPSVRCPTCEDEFGDAAALKEHRLEVHPVEKTFACDVCPTLFATNQALVIHKRVHEPKTSHVCDVCEASFSTKMALATHRKKHSSKEKKFACATCGKKFPLKCHLSRHLKTHD
ncbi:hypothetical protein JTE90_017928 [Oedothorax gibbosus]|uniref:C2H2-type domain-containing protein n=1 Tax=Oedothorax gibbosus TaxID=931172 RepID=A0AAV6TQ50_9ARAC|nr:hypothetical protein JTE90_017928 [Oedothorax gibbosus]